MPPSIPFVCYRCKYSSTDKTDMKRHLYKRKNICYAEQRDIYLSDELKQKILNKCPYQEPQPQIINNFIKTLNINENILNIE